MKKHFAIIFDMDGVIVNSNPYHKIALKQYCKEHGYDLTDEELRTQIYGRTNKDWLTRLFGHDLKPGRLKEMAEEKEQLFRNIFEPHIKPVKGLIPFLQQMENAGIPRAVATSAPYSNVRFTMEKTGIGQYFEIILDESAITKSKPDPEIYQKTVEVLDFSAENCWVIEDSLSGVESAIKAGCKVVAITTTHSDSEFHHADLIITDFDDLKLLPEKGLYLK